MKRTFLSMITLITMYTFSNGPVSVTMPDAQELTKRLTALGLDHFAEKSGILELVAGKTKNPIFLAADVEQAAKSYCELVNYPMMTLLIESSKPSIRRALVQDSPEAIQVLEKMNLL